MPVKRNTEGLKQRAAKKRQETFEKVDQGIRELLKEKRSINFHTVAQAAGVSRTWLYGEPEVRSRIEQLQAQGSGQKAPPSKQQVADASKDAIIRTLKERIKRLEEQNRQLNQQNQTFGGQIIHMREQVQHIQRIQAENTSLREQLNTVQAQSIASDHSTQITKPDTPIVERSIEDELIESGVDVNKTIKQMLSSTPHAVLKTALESLQEAVSQGRVNNPNGFFVSAVKSAYKPNGTQGTSSSNQPTQNTDMERDTFNRWYPLAYRLHLVKASSPNAEGRMAVMNADDVWIPFSEMLDSYNFEALANMQKSMKHSR